jgi:hypothetical protein
LTEVINKVRGTVMVGIKARALLVRSRTRRLLGENQLADEDLSPSRVAPPERFESRRDVSDHRDDNFFRVAPVTSGLASPAFNKTL